LNQYMERELDARMDRTRHRPLPDGRLAPIEALVLGLALLVAGLCYLEVAAGIACALVTAAIAVTYLLAYTPLKTRTSLCSLVGVGRGGAGGRPRRSRAGRQHAAASRQRPGCCSRSCTSGRSRTPSRSAGCTGTTTPAPASASSPSSMATARARRSRR